MTTPDLRKTGSDSGTRPKYQPLMELGSGGMAVVQLAMSRGPQGFVKLFVLKTLRSELLVDPGSRKMFMEEARISARLTHPNILQVYEVTEQRGVPAMVMEYLQGQALSSILKAKPQGLPLPLALHVIAKTLAGLHSAHELKDYGGTPLNVVHRDVSPHNVFVLYDGQVKVLDFGIAKVSGSSINTQSGLLKGKIRYMAPEQLAGQEQDRRADLFAVGIMLWELLARRRMWAGMADADVMYQLLTPAIPPLPPDLPISDGLRALCQRALSPDREGRPATAAAMLAELESCIERDGLRCAPDELGAFVSQEFERERRRTDEVVEAAVKAAALASLTPTAVASDDVPTARPPQTAEAARKRPPRSMAIGAGALALLLTLVAVYLYRGAQQDAPLSSTTPAASSPPVTAACSPGTKSCAGQCVSIDSPETGCGGEQCAACSLANATQRCNARNECDVAVCYRDFEDCDGNKANGCETNLKISASDCGACGRRCPDLPHAQAGCGDACTIWRCESGFRDCNAIVADGCEVAVRSDRQNCGHCGNRCPAEQKCVEGRCAR